MLVTRKRPSSASTLPSNGGDRILEIQMRLPETVHGLVLFFLQNICAFPSHGSARNAPLAAGAWIIGQTIVSGIYLEDRQKMHVPAPAATY
jgi:hypothetical protein